MLIKPCCCAKAQLLITEEMIASVIMNSFRIMFIPSLGRSSCSCLAAGGTDPLQA